MARRLAALVAATSLGAVLISCAREPSVPTATPRTTAAPPTGPSPFLVYERTGSSLAGTGQTLTITRSGDFDLRLTGGGPRIGRFAGTLGQDQMRAFRSAAARLAGPYLSPGSIGSESVTERLDVAGTTATITAHEELPPAWSEMVRLVRADAARLTNSPRAALELAVDVNPASGRVRGELHQLGAAPVHLADGPLMLSVAVLGGSDVVRDRWSITDAVDATEAGAGWVRDLALGRSGAILSRHETLVVTVELSVSDADGIVRRARLGLSRP